MTPKRSLTGRPRRRRLAVRLVGLAGAGGLVWLVGLFWFAALLPNAVTDSERSTDAIVVLTGGSDRLQQGLDLLAQRRAAQLFVTGVYRGVDVRELLRVSQQSPERLACCITLDHDAGDTRGNAVETAAWIREQDLRSLRLVTAAYHMPRSLLEFRHAMPEIEIVPHPVFPENFKQRDWWRWPGSASLIVREYSKYLVARLRGWVDGVRS